MWIWTTGGFLSAVEHRDDSSKLMVRARDKQSLETMIQGVELAGKAAGTEYEALEIVQKLPSDYPWRVEISKATFAIYVQHEIMNYLNYHNFKSALTAYRGEQWHKAAMNVWTDMLAVTDSPDNLYGASNKTYNDYRSYPEVWDEFDLPEDHIDEEIRASYAELEDLGEHGFSVVGGSEDEVADSAFKWDLEAFPGDLKADIKRARSRKKRRAQRAQKRMNNEKGE